MILRSGLIELVGTVSGALGLLPLSQNYRYPRDQTARLLFLAGEFWKDGSGKIERDGPP